MGYNPHIIQVFFYFRGVRRKTEVASVAYDRIESVFITWHLIGKRQVLTHLTHFVNFSLFRVPFPIYNF